MLRLGAELLAVLLGRELLLLPKLRLGLELLLLLTPLGRELLPTLLGRVLLLLLPEPKSRLGLVVLLLPTPLGRVLLLRSTLLLGVLPTPDSGLLVPVPTLRSLRPLFSPRPLFSMLPLTPLPSGRAVTRVELWLLPLNSPRSQRSCIPTCSLLGVRKCSLWP